MCLKLEGGLSFCAGVCDGRHWLWPRGERFTGDLSYAAASQDDLSIFARIGPKEVMRRMTAGEPYPEMRCGCPLYFTCNCGVDNDDDMSGHPDYRRPVAAGRAGGD